MTAVALVTGAASGIGRRTAELLVERGHRVVATDLRLEALTEVARAAGWDRDPLAERVELRALDVRDAASWEAAVAAAIARWERLDLLFNVAGYLRPGHLHEAEPSEVERHLDVNARGVMLGTLAAARVMAARGGGQVVNVASMAALAPIPGLALYSASKFAVRAFSLAAAHELRPRGVFVTVVCPDLVATPMMEAQVGHDAAALSFSGRRPLTVDEVAGALVGPVVARRPRELWLPRSRGLLARLADLFPGLGFALAPLLARKGRARQRALRGG